MQRARDFSEAQFHRFYPSHEDRTSLTTNHVEIGVFYHPYHRADSRFIRDRTQFPLHQQASAERTPPDFALHSRPGGARDSVFEAQRRARRAARGEANPLLLGTRSGYDEFADYETAYNNSVPPWHLRAIDASQQRLLPVFVAHQASPTQNPIGYMNSVLDGFARFERPEDLLTADEVRYANDLLGSSLDARFSSGYGPDGQDSLVGSLLNAKRGRLEPDNLFANMRLLAEKVLERKVLETQKPIDLNLTPEAYANELTILDQFIGNILSVRAQYMASGDVGVEDEMFANFDSKQDADDAVDVVPSAFNFAYAPADLNNTKLMLLRLKRFSKAEIPNVPNRLDAAIAEHRQLEQLKTPSAEQTKRKRELSRLIAQLSQVEGLRQSQALARTVVSEAERAQVAIAKRETTSTNELNRVVDELNSLEQELDEKNARLAKFKGGGLARKELEKEIADLYRRLANANTRFAKTQRDFAKIQTDKSANQERLKAAVIGVSDEVQKTRGVQSFRKRLPPVERKTALRPALYERAVALTMVDLVEKELRALQFATDKRAQIDDAVSTIENVRFQLPDGSKHELARFAGRGTLPFALAATSSSLSTGDVTTNYALSSQTQNAIRQLIAD